MPFFDIFSNKKEDKSRTTILIDNHEKNSLVPAELVNLGLQIEFTHLKVGDYLINDLAVERKTISDLKSSIINKRIFSQIQDIKQYPKCLLIVEGINDEFIYSGIIHENALRGFLLSATLDQHIPLVFTQDSKDTAKYLAIISNRKQNKKLSLRPGKVFFTKEERIQFILEGFPGIGPTKAKSLIKKFGSLKSIVDASNDELKEILGARTKDFRELINN
jgi:ERCC4-type nuclease